MYKVTHRLGPQFLFEKVNFIGHNQTGRPLHTHSMDGQSDRITYTVHMANAEREATPFPPCLVSGRKLAFTNC